MEESSVKVRVNIFAEDGTAVFDQRVVTCCGQRTDYHAQRQPKGYDMIAGSHEWRECSAR